MAPTEKHMGKEAAEPQRDWRMMLLRKAGHQPAASALQQRFLNARFLHISPIDARPPALNTLVGTWFHGFAYFCANCAHRARHAQH
jgi:hypothetical protein